MQNTTDKYVIRTAPFKAEKSLIAQGYTEGTVKNNTFGLKEFIRTSVGLDYWMSNRYYRQPKKVEA